MPVLTRCRVKKPEDQAMRPSPNPKKLKKAAKKLQEEKKKGKKATKETKDKEEKAAEKPIKTPSPKPILKKTEDMGGN